jgi:hypothetical protein
MLMKRMAPRIHQLNQICIGSHGFETRAVDLFLCAEASYDKYNEEASCGCMLHLFCHSIHLVSRCATKLIGLQPSIARGPLLVTVLLRVLGCFATAH